MSEEIKVGDWVEFFAEDQPVESGFGVVEHIDSDRSGFSVRSEGRKAYVVTRGSRYPRDFVRKVSRPEGCMADFGDGHIEFKSDVSESTRDFVRKVDGGIVLTYDPKEGPPPNPKKAFGAQKPDLALVPPASTLHEAMALEAGARKYGPYNWRKDPVESMTYVAAAIRHIQNWLDGEEYCSDDATVHNLGAAKAGLGILLDAMELGNLIDNRPPAGRSSAVQERMKAQKVARESGK